MSSLSAAKAMYARFTDVDLLQTCAEQAMKYNNEERPLEAYKSEYAEYTRAQLINECATFWRDNPEWQKNSKPSDESFTAEDEEMDYIESGNERLKKRPGTYAVNGFNFQANENSQSGKGFPSDDKMIDPLLQGNSELDESMADSQVLEEARADSGLSRRSIAPQQADLFKVISVASGDSQPEINAADASQDVSQDFKVAQGGIPAHYAFNFTQPSNLPQLSNGFGQISGAASEPPMDSNFSQEIEISQPAIVVNSSEIRNSQSENISDPNNFSFDNIKASSSLDFKFGRNTASKPSNINSIPHSMPAPGEPREEDDMEGPGIGRFVPALPFLENERDKWFGLATDFQEKWLAEKEECERLKTVEQELTGKLKEAMRQVTLVAGQKIEEHRRASSLETKLAKCRKNLANAKDENNMELDLWIQLHEDSQKETQAAIQERDEARREVHTVQEGNKAAIEASGKAALKYNDSLKKRMEETRKARVERDTATEEAKTCLRKFLWEEEKAKIATKQLNDLQATLAAAQQEIQKAVQEKVSESRRADSLEIELKTTRQQMNIELSRANDREMELNEARQQINTEVSRVESLRIESNTVQQQRDSESGRIDAIQTELEIARRNMSLQSSRTDGLKTELDAVTQQRDSEHDQVNYLKKSLETIAQDIEAKFEADLRAAQKAIEVFETRLVHLQREHNLQQHRLRLRIVRKNQTRSKMITNSVKSQNFKSQTIDTATPAICRELSEARTQVQNLQETLSTKAASIERLESELSGSKIKFQTLSGDLRAETANNEFLKSQISKSQAEVQDLERDLSAGTEKARILQSDLNSLKESTVSREIEESLRSRIRELDNDLSTQLERLEEKDREIKSLEGKIESHELLLLKHENQSISVMAEAKLQANRIEKLEQEAAIKAVENRSIELELNESHRLKNEIKRYKSAFDRLNKEASQLRKSNTRLTLWSSELQKSLDDSRSLGSKNMADLKSQYSELEETYKTQNTELLIARGKISEAEQKVSTQNSKISQFKEENFRLELDLQELKLQLETRSYNIQAALNASNSVEFALEDQIAAAQNKSHNSKRPSETAMDAASLGDTWSVVREDVEKAVIGAQHANAGGKQDCFVGTNSGTLSWKRIIYVIGAILLTFGVGYFFWIITQTILATQKTKPESYNSPMTIIPDTSIFASPNTDIQKNDSYYTNSEKQKSQFPLRPVHASITITVRETATITNTQLATETVLQVVPSLSPRGERYTTSVVPLRSSLLDPRTVYAKPNAKIVAASSLFSVLIAYWVHGLVGRY